MHKLLMAGRILLPALALAATLGHLKLGLPVVSSFGFSSGR